jgi:MFS family permease
MATIEEARTNLLEHQPLLGSQATINYAGKPRWRFWPTFTTTAAFMRAIEAMHCIEFYATRNPNIAALGKHIPERLCKDHVIQKQLAKTAGLIMFFRMFAAVLGAGPLGQLADRMGRKPVLVLHKLNTFVSNVMWLSICECSGHIFIPPHP